MSLEMLLLLEGVLDVPNIIRIDQWIGRASSKLRGSLNIEY